MSCLLHFRRTGWEPRKQLRIHVTVVRISPFKRMWAAPFHTDFRFYTMARALAHTHTHACTHAHTHACTHARTHAYTHARTHTHTHTLAPPPPSPGTLPPPTPTLTSFKQENWCHKGGTAGKKKKCVKQKPSNPFKIQRKHTPSRNTHKNTHQNQNQNQNAPLP